MSWLYFRGDAAAKLSALAKSQAVIEFTVDGNIVTANDNFLALVGYHLDEIKGRHHGIFVDAKERESAAYRQFWDDLRAGKYQQAEYRRVGKGGSEVWIHASYNPLIRRGKVFKVVKYATDISATKLRAADIEGQLAALHKAQAVIEFDLSGNILGANENFLAVVGYRLDEIKGCHHSMFVDPQERGSPAYAAFWQALAAGGFQAAQYKRIAKGGKPFWIQASYNPIFDMNGRPFKVVKFATDITARVEEQARRGAAHAEIDRDVIDISQAVSRATHEATEAAAASTQTAGNVHAVAAGAEEMATSVREISRQVAQSQEISSRAVDEATRTNDIVASLSDAAQRIGDVVELISSIAAQTNLLALNATIEAARAGEAGRGFAVVASEVKSLAAQTSKATEEIAGHIASVQATTENAVQAIGGISSTISAISTISTEIAAAVEQQSAVTAEMSGNMRVAADGVEAISQSMNAIARSTASIEAAAHQVRETSRSVA